MSLLPLLLLSGLAALFAFGGLLGSRRSTSYRQTAKALYQQRLEELDREVDSDEARAALELEASHAVLGDTENESEAELHGAEHAPGSTSTKVKLALLALLIPVVGWAWYVGIGDLGLAQIQGAEVVLQLDADDAEQQAQLRDWQQKLTARTTARPDDAKSLYLLAHTELKLGAFQKAASAFASAADQNPEDISIKVYWLQARFLAAKGHLDELSLSLADEVLAAAPNLSVVLEILAMDAVRKGQPDQAVAHLNRALSGAREARTQVNFVSAITELRKQFELPGVTVEVEAATSVPPQSTLFVIARPVGGGMPLAVVKMPAVLLPQTVRLDDLVTMSGTSRLSDAEQFEVVVRISNSGSPMAQAGDWQWQSEPLRLPSEQVLQAELAPPD